MDKTASKPMPDECAAQTPIDDLERNALAHYEEISAKACHWYSVIPRAIKFYFDAQRRPNPETQAVAQLEVRNGIASLKHLLAPIDQVSDGMMLYRSPSEPQASVREQEPVAWCHKFKDGTYVVYDKAHVDRYKDEMVYDYFVPLYAHPAQPPAQVDALQEAAAEVYQYVGTLLSDAGRFDSPEALILLDLLSWMSGNRDERPDTDKLLPFASIEHTLAAGPATQEDEPEATQENTP